MTVVVVVRGCRRLSVNDSVIDRHGGLKGNGDSTVLIFLIFTGKE